MPTFFTAPRALLSTLLFVLIVVCAPALAAAPLVPQPAGACPASIAFGQTLPCSIAGPGQLASFSFMATASDHVLVRMVRLSGTLSPQIQVIGSGGAPICQQNGAIVAEISGCLLASGGSYTIQAGDYNGTATGDFALALQRVNNPSGATALSLGLPQTATLADPGELDSYTFAGAANDLVVARMGSGAVGLSPHLRLYAPDGTSLCEKSGAAPAQEITACQLTTTGQYTLVVSDYAGADTGAYGVIVQRLVSPGNAATLAFGQAAPAIIGAPGELDSYTFAANFADTAIVRVGSTASGLTPHIRVYGPDGSKLCEGFSNDPATDTNECLLPYSGNYTVLVNDYNGADTGGYGIAIQRLNNPMQALASTFGQPLSGSFTTPGQLASYTFGGAQGDAVLVRMGGAASGVAPQIRLYGPNGAYLCNANGAPVAEIPHCVLPAIGTYTVLVNDFDHGTTGGYGLTLQRLNNPGGATALLLGQAVGGAINAPGQLATYTFAGRANNSVRIRMTSSPGGIYPSLRLYDPDGALLCQANGRPGVVELGGCVLPGDATYTLVATNYNGAGQGSYSLVISCMASDCGPVAQQKFVYLPMLRR